MIEIKNLSKRYGIGFGGKLAVDNLSLTINKGEIIGLFGGNGAGKTTLMKSILGLLDHDGEVTLDGQKITRKNISRLSFATSEHSFFPNITPEDHREFYKMNFPGFNEARFDSLMKFFDLPKNRALRGFSTGQKNQFEVILALSQGAEYIFMDEPFAGNDIFNREDFYKVLLGILDENETIILSTHLIEEVENFVSRAVVLRNGRLIADVSADNLADRGLSLTAFIKETYGYQSSRVRDALDALSGQEDGKENR